MISIYTRYKSKLEDLSEIFDEKKLCKLRIFIEIYWIQKILPCLPQISGTEISQYADFLNKISFVDEQFDTEHQKILEIEKECKHDIKAIEIYIRNLMKEDNLSSYLIETTHLGLTSQDIVSTSNTIMLSKARNLMIWQIMDLLDHLDKLDSNIEHISRTHGQFAVPVRFGHTFKVYKERLKKLSSSIQEVKLLCKFGGAVGNFSSLKEIYPGTDWEKLANAFVKQTSENFDVDISRTQYSTQVDCYDSHRLIWQYLADFSDITINLCQDIWYYISVGELIKKEDISCAGSSTMSQKTNPIEFENAEGNLKLSSNLFKFFSTSLSSSRLYRDLTDSTQIRNIELPYAYFQLGIKSLIDGIKKLEFPTEFLENQIEENQQIYAEKLQYILRSHGLDGYNITKELFKNKKIDKKEMDSIVSSLSKEYKLNIKL